MQTILMSWKIGSAINRRTSILRTVNLCGMRMNRYVKLEYFLRTPAQKQRQDRRFMELTGCGGAPVIFGTGMGPGVARIMPEIRGPGMRHRMIPSTHRGCAHWTIAVRAYEMDHLGHVAMETCINLVRGHQPRRGALRNDLDGLVHRHSLPGNCVIPLG